MRSSGWREYFSDSLILEMVWKLSRGVTRKFVWNKRKRKVHPINGDGVVKTLRENKNEKSVELNGIGIEFLNHWGDFMVKWLKRLLINLNYVYLQREMGRREYTSYRCISLLSIPVKEFGGMK